MKIAKKSILIVLCAALLVGVSIMGTVAYLQSQSPTSSYTITVGNVSIALVEEKLVGSEIGYLPVDDQSGVQPHKLTPGTTVDKSVKVMVHRNSQSCWLFVKIDKSGLVMLTDAKGNVTEYTCDDFLAYAMAEGWEALDVQDQIIFYRKVEASEDDQIIDILGKENAEQSRWSEDQIYVKDTVTKEMLKALEAADAELPALIFTAYAIQGSGFRTAADAWAAIANQTAPATSVPVTESVSTEPDA